MDAAALLTFRVNRIDAFLRACERRAVDLHGFACQQLVDEACAAGAFRSEVGCRTALRSFGWSIHIETRLA